jgi:hypothetical protein
MGVGITRPTPTTAVFVKRPSVVPTKADDLPGVLRGDGTAAPGVLSLRHGLEVCRVHARTRARGLPWARVEPVVVEREPFRDRADEQSIGDAMGRL